MPKVLARRVHRDVARARPRRPQLQPAHAGRVARDDEGARDRPLRHGAVDDRQRLLGRLARPAAGGERLSGRLPGHHAAVLVHGRVVVRDAVRGVLLRPASSSRTRRAGGSASSTTRRRQTAFFDHPNIANPITFTTVIPNSGEPVTVVPGRAERQGLRRADEPGRRALHAPGLHGQRVRPRRARLRPARLRQRRRPVRAEGPARRPHLARPVRRLQRQHRRGGHRPQHHRRAHRGRPDRAASALYRTGAINSANNLDKVAIIDLRGPDPGAFHDVYRTYAMRARLERNFGTAANQVLWRGQAPLIGDPSFADDAVFAMDRWLARVHADHRKRPAARARSSRTSPTRVAPRCTDGNGKDVPVRGVRPDRVRLRHAAPGRRRAR